MLFPRRASALFVALLALNAAASSRAAISDIGRVLLGRAKLHLQLGPGDPLVEPQPFAFVAAVIAAGPNRVSGGAFTYGGGGPVFSLNNQGGEVFNFGQVFTTAAAMDVAFPAGTYNFGIATSTPPTDVLLNADLTGQFPLTVPKLVNTQWRSVVLQFDSRSDFTFVTNQFADFRFDPVHGSEVELAISDIFNHIVLDRYDPAQPTNTLTLPGGTLLPGIYVGRLFFTHTDQQNVIGGTTTIGDFNAMVTEFVLSVVDGPPDVTSEQITVNTGQLFVYGIDATNLPTQFAAANLPPGNIRFDPASGIFGGYPTTPGTYAVDISANNIVGTGTGRVIVNVQQSTLAITSSTKAAGRAGTPFRFQVLCPGATRAARVSASGLPAGLQINDSTGEISGAPSKAGDYLVNLQVTDGNATTRSILLISVDEDPAFPAIVSPTTVNIVPGQNFTYQINGAPISTSASSGGTNAADAPTYSVIGELPVGLTFDPKTGTISGRYSGSPLIDADQAKTRLSGGALVGNVQLIATNSRGTATIPLCFFTAPIGAVNISTRLAIAGGDNVLIGGFIVTGNAPKRLIVRALGPSLPVPGALQDPVLEIHGSDGSLLVTNDSWKSDNAQGVMDSGVAPTDDREAAIVGAFEPNVNYTAILRGKNGSSGVALLELYDLGTAAFDGSSAAKLANISTRGLVQTGDNVMIGGFIVSQVQSKVVVRAIGPSLAAGGVSGALLDTTLELRGPNGDVVASNDDWQSDPVQAQAIRDSGVPPTDPRESAVVATLNPGSYTAIARGKNDMTGVGLVEVYVLQ